MDIYAKVTIQDKDYSHLLGRKVQKPTSGLLKLIAQDISNLDRVSLRWYGFSVKQRCESHPDDARWCDSSDGKSTPLFHLLKKFCDLSERDVEGTESHVLFECIQAALKAYPSLIFDESIIRFIVTCQELSNDVWQYLIERAKFLSVQDLANTLPFPKEVTKFIRDFMYTEECVFKVDDVIEVIVYQCGYLKPKQHLPHQKYSRVRDIIRNSPQVLKYRSAPNSRGFSKTVLDLLCNNEMRFESNDEVDERTSLICEAIHANPAFLMKTRITSSPLHSFLNRCHPIASNREYILRVLRTTKDLCPDALIFRVQVGRSIYGHTPLHHFLDGIRRTKLLKTKAMLQRKPIPHINFDFLLIKEIVNMFPIEIFSQKILFQGNLPFDKALFDFPGDVKMANYIFSEVVKTENMYQDCLKELLLVQTSR